MKEQSITFFSPLIPIQLSEIVYCSLCSGSTQQQVQDEYVQGLAAAGRLSERGQLHFCPHAGGA